MLSRLISGSRANALLAAGRGKAKVDGVAEIPAREAQPHLTGPVRDRALHRVTASRTARPVFSGPAHSVEGRPPSRASAATPVAGRSASNRSARYGLDLPVPLAPVTGQLRQRDDQPPQRPVVLDRQRRHHDPAVPGRPNSSSGTAAASSGRTWWSPCWSELGVARRDRVAAGPPGSTRRAATAEVEAAAASRAGHLRRKHHRCSVHLELSAGGARSDRGGGARRRVTASMCPCTAGDVGVSAGLLAPARRSGSWPWHGPVALVGVFVAGRLYLRAVAATGTSPARYPGNVLRGST